MGRLSFFTNPAMDILEQRLWDDARTRYLREHPAEAKDDAKSVRRKVKTVYQDTVGTMLKEADHKVRAKWAQFKHVMTEELKVALSTVLRMSEIDWYSVEVGQLPSPAVIAVPYELLKHTTVDVMLQFLKKSVDFEDLDDRTLEALATYASDQKFHAVLEDARHNHWRFQIGNRATRFVVAEIIKRDPYFLDDDEHHSVIDMVILASGGGSSPDPDKKEGKAAVTKWFELDRKNRKNDRRFIPDGWEIDTKELKAWTVEH